MEKVIITMGYDEKLKTYKVYVTFGDDDEQHILFTGDKDYATAAYYSAISLLDAMNNMSNVEIYEIVEKNNVQR